MNSLVIDGTSDRMCTDSFHEWPRGWPMNIRVHSRAGYNIMLRWCFSNFFQNEYSSEEVIWIAAYREYVFADIERRIMNLVAIYWSIWKNKLDFCIRFSIEKNLLASFLSFLMIFLKSLFKARTCYYYVHKSIFLLSNLFDIIKISPSAYVLNLLPLPYEWKLKLIFINTTNRTGIIESMWVPFYCCSIIFNK